MKKLGVESIAHFTFALLASEHGAVGGVRVWLPYACPSAWAIKREYTKTLDELQMHRHGVGGDLSIY